MGYNGPIGARPLAKINPQRIVGKWQGGGGLGLHPPRSIYLGVNEFGHEVYDTTRSEIGELLYRLKYKGDMAAAEEIIDAAAAYLVPHRDKIDVIVPVPPSGARVGQPVITLARG